MRVLLLTHDTTVPQPLRAALEALGHEVVIRAGEPMVVEGESYPVALALDPAMVGQRSQAADRQGRR